MSADRIRDLLDAAGVDTSALGATESLSFPAATVDEARAPLREGAVREAPLGVRSGVLAAIGLSAALDVAGRRVAFSAAADLPFAVDAAGAAGARPDAVPTDAPLDFVITAPAAGPLAVGAVSSGGLRLQSLHAWPAPPLDAWREAAGEAEWLLLAQPPPRLRRARAGEDGLSDTGTTRWTETLIAGRVSRLLQPPDAPPLIAARKWTRGLTAGQRQLVERFAVVAARQMATKLDRLQATIVPDEPGLVTRWRALCYERDDLEGIRVLLREARTGDALAAALAAADAIGRALHFSWPSDADVHDDRLQRVAEGHPGAWWGGTRRRAFVL